MSFYRSCSQLQGEQFEISDDRPIWTKMTSPVWKDRLFPTKRIVDLPRACAGLAVEYATEDDLTDCRRMIVDSARRGDNVGTDEFDGEEAFANVLRHSEVFVARGFATSEAKAFIVIQPCLYIRYVVLQLCANISGRLRSLCVDIS